MRLTNLFASSLLLASACGGDHPKATPDAPPPPPDAADPHDITIQTTNYFTGAGSNIELLAIQDGDGGAWTVLTGTNGAYKAHVTGDRYAIMTACHDGPDLNDTSIWYRHISEGAFATYTCDNVPSPLHLTISLTNLPANANARLEYEAGGSIGAGTIYASGAFGPFDVPKGALEGVIRIRSIDDNHTLGLIRIPATDLQADKTIAIDATTALAPQSLPLTVSGSTDLYVRSLLRTPHWTYPVDQEAAESAGYHYTAAPASLVAAGDLAGVEATAPDGRMVGMLEKTAGPVTLALPAADLKATTTALLQAPYLRPSFTYTAAAKALANQEYRITVFTETRALLVTLSSAWMGSATTSSFTMPDFSALPGYKVADFTLEANQEIDWTIDRAEDNGIVGDGAIFTSATAGGAMGAYCGNGVKDPGEACDDAGDSATCNADCTAAKCGDSYVNAAAGEECDPPDGATCDASCKNLPQARAPMTREAAPPRPAIDVLERRQRATLVKHRLR